MNEVQTITDIRTIKNAIKEGIKKVDTTNYQEEKFGKESEYTYKDYQPLFCMTNMERTN
jgi:hypothetical protein